MTSTPDLMLELALDLAHCAGAELVHRHGDVRGLRTKSTATDPVSDADLASERLIADGLAAARPDDGLLGEEGSARPSSSGIRWVVDPLDGTVNYLYGLPGWAISIAAEDADGALVGVVHDPSAQRTWYATRGGGAFRRDGDGAPVPLRVNDPVPLGSALLATGFPYGAERRAAMGAFIGAMLPHVRDIRRIGAAAADLCWLAQGSVDVYLEHGVNHWDVAAGSLIATEAGALVRTVDLGNGVEALLAAGPALVPQVLDAIGTA